MKRFIHGAAVALGLPYVGMCWAADPPSLADEAARQFQLPHDRERLLRERRESQKPDVRIPRDAASVAPTSPGPQDESCFPIRSIELKGDEAERFAFALDSIADLGRWADSPACLGVHGIDRIMQAVQGAIVTRGYVTTRVLAKSQDLQTGVLTLSVLLGRVRSIVVAGEGGDRATLLNAMAASPGDLLDLRDVEQSLENLKRLPTVEADVEIASTDQPGWSDLRVTWKQAFSFRFNVSLDDAGSRSTGKYQGSATVSYDHWLTLNDLFYVTFLNDLGGGDDKRKGTHGRAVHYSVPFGYWLFGITASDNSYLQSVAGPYQNYTYTGDSSNGEVRLSRLLFRDASHRTTAHLAGWTRRSRNFIDGTEVEVQQRRMGGFELGLSQREYWGAATADLDLTYKRGTGAFGSIAAPEEGFGEGTARPHLFKAEGRFSLPWTALEQRWRYNATWRAQWNRTPLVAQDRFAIGGRYTVRGFDGESVLSAERGWLLRQELAWSIPDQPAELFVGLDTAKVGGPSAGQLVGTRLTGAVMGLRSSWRGTQLEAFAGAPVRKPDAFRSAGSVAGFSLSWSF